MTEQQCRLIAGPCSINPSNVSEVMRIGDVTVTNLDGQRVPAAYGTRIVGVKSRTAMGELSGMGQDAQALLEAQRILRRGGGIRDIEPFPSTLVAGKVFDRTGMLIATEICDTLIQPAQYVGVLPAGAAMLWNPAVEQLGWPIAQLGAAVRENGWDIGIKNGKWLGGTIYSAEGCQGVKVGIDDVWAGLASYVSVDPTHTWLIQRGVDVPERGDYRSAPIHATAMRVKARTGAHMLFDPSHTLGPKMRGSIVDETVAAMQLTMADGTYVYDGALIEVCDPALVTTDTGQHITVEEFQVLAGTITQFRQLESRA